MEIYTSLVLLILGLQASFFFGIISELSLDDISNLIEKDYKSAQKLQKLQSEFSYNVNSFQIIELILISTSIVFFVDYIFKLPQVLEMQIAMVVAYIIFVLISKYTIMAYGLKHSAYIAPVLANVIYFYDTLAYPITKSIFVINKYIAGDDIDEASREDIKELVETAREEGSIEPDEYRILKNIMNFAEVPVSDVMTPRTVMFTLDSNKSVDDVLNLPELQMYSRFPIWEGESVDDGIIGYVMSKDILQAKLSGKGNAKIRDFSREVFFILENTPLDTTLSRFLNRRQHLFIVVDEYGGIEGIITMEDVVETMLGVEIVDEVDKVVDLRQLAKQRRDSRIALIN